MRGAYFLKKAVAQDVIAPNHAEGDLYPRDFIVWSNVPTCMTANELGGKFGYALGPNVTALHREGSDGVSMGHDLPQRVSENLKSLCMLFYRNRVFPGSEEEQKHNLLVRFNTRAVEKLMEVNQEDASQIIESLEVVAQALDSIDDPSTFEQFIADYAPYSHERVSPFIIDLGKRIADFEVYRRVKELRSLRPEVPSYTVVN